MAPNEKHEMCISSSDLEITMEEETDHTQNLQIG